MTILQYLLTHISYRNRNKVSVWTLSLCKAYFEDVGKLQSCSVFLGRGKVLGQFCACQTTSRLAIVVVMARDTLFF